MQKKIISTFLVFLVKKLELFMKTYYYFLVLCTSLFIILSCETTLGPNELGGNTDIELTKVGNDFGVTFSLDGNWHPALGNVKNSTKIIKNQGGIVTIKNVFSIDEASLREIDTLLGTQNLPESTKRAIVDFYKEKYGVTIDTSNKQNMQATFELKLKITSDGFQDFVHSKGDESKPFTIMKYADKIGTKYEFTTKDGEKITRTVTKVHTTEDWNLGFLEVKTMRVEQDTPNDPITKKITYVGNHKFGFVGMIFETKDGKIFSTTIMPWAVL